MNYSIFNFFVGFLLFGSVIFSFSSVSLFFIWICLELNLMMYISMEKNYSSFMVVSMMKYYIIQGLSSMIFLFLILYNFSLIMINIEVVNFLVFLAMWVKLGFFPFSSWYFNISENMDWVMWFLLNTMQKLIPLLVLSFSLWNMSMVVFLIMINMMYTSIEVWNQVSMRWIVNCSSLNHFSWMIVSLGCNFTSWELYYLIYFFVNLVLIIYMCSMNWSSFLSIFIDKSFYSILIFMVVFFNFSGVPPFLGFLGKLLVLKVSEMFYILLMLMLNTVVTTVVYMKFFMSSLSILLKTKMNFFKVFSIFILTGMSMFMLSLLLFLF